MLDRWSVMVKTKRLHEKRVFKWAPDHVQLLREWTRRKNNTLASTPAFTSDNSKKHVPSSVRSRLGWAIASSSQQCENCRLDVASAESVPCPIPNFQDAIGELVASSNLFTSYFARDFL